MSNYLVHCDGCGQPEVVSNPNDYTCSNCGYQMCTIDETPRTEKEKDILQKCLYALNPNKNSKIGGELADFWEDTLLNGPDDDKDRLITDKH